MGTLAGLLADAEGGVWALVVGADEFERLRAAHAISAAVRRGEMVEARIVARGQPHPAVVPAAPTLEEAYLLFAGDAAMDSAAAEASVVAGR